MSPRWADLSAIAAGASASATLRLDEDTIARAAEWTGDANPIHVDPAAAREFGQSRTVAHGVILLGAISRLIGSELPGPGSVWFQNDIEFTAPMYAGDTVTVTLTVRQVSLSARVVVLDVVAENASKTVVAQGRARVRVPAPISQQDTTMQNDTRVAVVTGGSQGIGRTVAETLGASGLAIVVGYGSDGEAAASCVAAIREKGGRAEAVAANLTAAGGVQQLVDGALAAFGRIDVIVHAATPPITTAPFLETPIDAFRTYFDMYVGALAHLVQLTAPAMKERRFGRIVTLLSSAIDELPPKLSPYITAKHAALGLCRSLAVELGPANITVNAVSPSMVVGRRTDELGSAARETMTRKTPLRRLAEAQDVANAVEFLVSDEASFVSGANLPVTGGLPSA